MAKSRFGELLAIATERSRLADLNWSRSPEENARSGKERFIAPSPYIPEVRAKHEAGGLERGNFIPTDRDDYTSPVPSPVPHPDFGSW